MVAMWHVLVVEVGCCLLSITHNTLNWPLNTHNLPCSSREAFITILSGVFA